MNIDLKTSPIACERRDFPNGRFYTPLSFDKRGKDNRPKDQTKWDWRASVTTILDQTLDKGLLRFWYMTHTEEQIEKILAETGKKGEILHALCMHLIWGRRIDLDELFIDQDTGEGVKVSDNWYRQRLMCFQKFWETYQPVPLATEIMLLNPERKNGNPIYPFAGQPDFVCRISPDILGAVCKIKNPPVEGEVWMLDWKSGKALYPSFGLQLTGYKLLWESLFDEHIDRLFCLHLKDTWIKHIPYIPTEYQFTPETWLSTLDAYRFLNGKNGEFPRPSFPPEFPSTFNLYEEEEEE